MFARAHRQARRGDCEPPRPRPYTALSFPEVRTTWVRSPDDDDDDDDDETYVMDLSLSDTWNAGHKCWFRSRMSQSCLRALIIPEWLPARIGSHDLDDTLVVSSDGGGEELFRGARVPCGMERALVMR